MKIAPITFGITKTPGFKKSVLFASFKSVPPIFSAGMNELETVINKEITPFVNESRNLYIETGKIGYRAQQAVNYISSKDNELYHHKFNLQNNAISVFSPEISVAWNLAKELKTNLKTFESIEKMSKLPMYDNPELQTKIKEAKSDIFGQNKKFAKIELISACLSSTFDKIDNEMEKINLQSDKNLYNKFKNTKNQLLSAQYYLFITPYNDAIKLKLNHQELKSSLENPAISAYTKLDNIEKSQIIAEKIVKDKEIYHKNRKEIEKFVKENKNLLPPSDDEINSTYKKLTEKCSEIFKTNIIQASDFVQKNSQNINIEIKNAKKLLKKQKETNNALYAIIDKIKTDYIIAENNKFYEKLDF